MRSRRRKSSPLKTLTLWTICLGLIGWGLYQVDVFRRSLPDASPPAEARPDLAVNSDWVNADDTPDGKSDVVPVANAQTSLLSGAGVEPTTGDSLENLAAIEPATYPAFDAALSAEELFTQGMRRLDSGEIVAGRFALNAALARATGADGEARAQSIRSLLSGLNTPVFLGSAVLPDDPAARLVDIQTDDTFQKIAHTYGLPTALLPVLNASLNANNLKPQTGIKIVQGPFHARLVKHDGRLDLYARDQYVTSLHVEFPEGNYLPRGDYQISPGTKLQLGLPASGRTWIGFHGTEAATEQVASGWIFGSAGPRGTTTRDLVTGVRLSDADVQTLFITLTENHSRLQIDP